MRTYTAHCIEDGERFISKFESEETEKSRLRKQGQEVAIEWGAECIKVTKDKTLRDKKDWFLPAA